MSFIFFLIYISRLSYFSFFVAFQRMINLFGSRILLTYFPLMYHFHLWLSHYYLFLLIIIRDYYPKNFVLFFLQNFPSDLILLTLINSSFLSPPFITPPLLPCPSISAFSPLPKESEHRALGIKFLFHVGKATRAAPIICVFLISKLIPSGQRKIYVLQGKRK